MACSTIDQRLRTIVEIDENDSYTNSSSSCFTSPSLDSPPAIRRLQTLSLAPRTTYDLFSPGIYSSFGIAASEPNTTTLILNRKLTSNSDSGRESVDSSFSSSENELSPPIKRYTTKSLTIYQIEKAKELKSSPNRSCEKDKKVYTASSKVYIGGNDSGQKFESKNANESRPTTTVLKIYIPPIVEKNVADKIACQKEQEKKEKSTYIKPFLMDISSPRTGSNQQKIVTPKYGVNPSDYRVVAWETKDSESPPGRIEDFKPEVDRWHNAEKAVNSTPDRPNTHRFNSSSSTSSSLELATGPEVEPIKEEESGNTLSDISSYSSETSECQLTTTDSVKSSNKPQSYPNSLKSSISHNSLFEKKHPNSIKSSISHNSSFEKNHPTLITQVRIRETTDSMLQDRIVEVGVQPWRSQSLEKFTKSSTMQQGPRLIEERTKSKVIFPKVDQQQHLYENIDDCREQVEHPKKVMPIPNRRLPFRQSARVPLLSVPTVDVIEKNDLNEVDPEISYVSYRFYDKNMQEQNSLSQRCSAQLLRKSAMRLSLPRNSNQTFRRRIMPPPVQTKYQQSQTIPVNHHNPREPLRYQLTQNYPKNKQKGDSIVTVNGKTSCVNCHLQLGKGEAMTIDSLGLFYHLHCFRCATCGILLNSGESRGMDVRVSGTKIQCNQCYNLSEDYYNQI